jgi:hypothetical protein
MLHDDSSAIIKTANITSRVKRRGIYEKGPEDLSLRPPFKS